jgi:Tfp pilus assembly protein PilV
MIAAGFRKRKRGTSLVEMIIAVVVLGIVLLGMMAGIIIAQGGLVFKEREAAVEVALRRLEDLESVPFSSLSSAAAAGPGIVGKYTVNVVTVPSPVKSKDISADVRVTVSWGGVVGATKSIMMNREVSASAWQNVGVLD